MKMSIGLAVYALLLWYQVRPNPVIRRPPMPRMKVEVTVVIPPQSGDWEYTLAKTPVQEMGMIVYFRSSRTGMDIFYATDIATDRPRLIQVQLPTYRPFTNQDKITFVYWTWE